MLANAEYEGADFGSYASVKQRIEEANKRVVGARSRGETPDPHDEFLSQCTPGHLHQDGLCRAAGRRGDPCAAHVDGYDSDLAPSMPIHGDGNTQGTDEFQMGRHERDSIRRRGLNANDSYPAGAMRDDANARLKTLPRFNRPGTEGVGRGTPPRVTEGGAPRDASVAQGVDPNAPKVGGSQKAPVADGDSAAECVNSFRALGEEAMRQKCVDDLEVNKKTLARDPAAEAESARAAREAAETRERDARAALQTQQKKADDAGGVRALSADDRKAFGQAKNDAAAAGQAADRARNAEREAAQLPAQQANARCRVEQAERIVAERGGGPAARRDGVVPDGWDHFND